MYDRVMRILTVDLWLVCFWYGAFEYAAKHHILRKWNIMILRDFREKNERYKLNVGKMCFEGEEYIWTGEYRMSHGRRTVDARRGATRACLDQ